MQKINKILRRGIHLELDFIMIGNRIRRQREYLGYTREYLSEKLGVSTNFCRDIEIGAKGMSIQTLHRLADTLLLSTDYILLGYSKNNDVTPLTTMLASCPQEKLKYAEDILKTFLLSIN